MDKVTEDAIKEVLQYSPPQHRLLIGSTSAFTFDTKDRKGQICYQNSDHSTCLIATETAQKVILSVKPSQDTAAARANLRHKQFTHIRGLEHQAENYAFFDQSLRIFAVSGIVGGQLLHYLGIDAPLIGGPLSSARWGLLAACIDPRAAGLAFIHTLFAGNPLIGPAGLFTRGTLYCAVIYGVRMALCFPAQDRLSHAYDNPPPLPPPRPTSTAIGQGTRILPREELPLDQVCRKSFDQDYQALWHGFAKGFEKELEYAQANNLRISEKVVRYAQQLMAKADGDFKQIYGHDVHELGNQLAVACHRIEQYNLCWIDDSHFENLTKKLPNFPMSYEAQETKLEKANDLTKRKEAHDLIAELHSKVINQIYQLIGGKGYPNGQNGSNEKKVAQPNNLIAASTNENEKPPEDLIKAIIKAAGVPGMDTYPGPKEGPAEHITWIRGKVKKAKEIAGDVCDPLAILVREKMIKLADDLDCKINLYDQSHHGADTIEEAIVVAYLLAESKDDRRFELKQRKAILNLAHKNKWESTDKLKLLNLQIHEGQEFNRWVNELTKKLLDECQQGYVPVCHLIQWVNTLAPRMDIRTMEANEVPSEGYAIRDQWKRYKAHRPKSSSLMKKTSVQKY
ncbi:MAG: hypothetical protein AB7F31_02525 [Parachlamydiales bacterium]